MDATDYAVCGFWGLVLLIGAVIVLSLLKDKSGKPLFSRHSIAGSRLGAIVLGLIFVGISIGTALLTDYIFFIFPIVALFALAYGLFGVNWLGLDPYLFPPKVKAPESDDESERSSSD